MKPNLPLSNEVKEKAVITMKSGRKEEAFKGPWQNGFMQVRSRELGDYVMLVDQTAPTVRPVGWANGAQLAASKSISLVIKDDVSELERCDIFIDGKWSLFSRKNDTFTHNFANLTKGRHQLKVVASDLAGNVSEKTLVFTR